MRPANRRNFVRQADVGRIDGLPVTLRPFGCCEHGLSGYGFGHEQLLAHSVASLIMGPHFALAERAPLRHLQLPPTLRGPPHAGVARGPAAGVGAFG